MSAVAFPVQAPRHSERFGFWARRVGLGKLAWFLLSVVLPTVSASVYYFGLAADHYVSEFLCVVRSSEGQSGPVAMGTGATSFMSSVGSQNVLESNVVVQYIKSSEMVSLLDEKLDLRRRYSTSRADFIARLDPGASAEDLAAYWNSRVEPFYDMTTGTVSVRIKAFTPQDAREIAEEVIQRSEALVNAMSERARADAVRLDQAEVDGAAEQLRQIRQRILDFRNQQQMIDPRKEAESNLSLVSKLRERLAMAQADLKSYGGASEAPSAKALRIRIDALQQQIALASAPVTTVVDRQKSAALSESVGGFESLDTKRLLAEKYYESALSMLEKANHDAERKMSYLVVFVEPNLPQSATYPKRGTSVMLTLLAGFGLWVFGIVIFHSVREHI